MPLVGSELVIASHPDILLALVGIVLLTSIFKLLDTGSLIAVLVDQGLVTRLEMILTREMFLLTIGQIDR